MIRRISGYTQESHAGVAESADASDLIEKLSARRETGDAELLKFGETSRNGNPEPSPDGRYVSDGKV